MERLNSGLHDFISHRKYRRKYYNEAKVIQKKIQKEVESCLENVVGTSMFETGKNYHRYFPKYNPSAVIKNLDKVESTIHNLISQMKCFERSM